MSHSYFIWKPRETSTRIFHACKFYIYLGEFNGRRRGGGVTNRKSWRSSGTTFLYDASSSTRYLFVYTTPLLLHDASFSTWHLFFYTTTLSIHDASSSTRHLFVYTTPLLLHDASSSTRRLFFYTTPLLYDTSSSTRLLFFYTTPLLLHDASFIIRNCREYSMSTFSFWFQGSFDVTGLSFDVDASAFPSGDYKITGSLTSGGKQAACLELVLTIA